MPTVTVTFVQVTYYAPATFVHINNISAVTGPILTKFFAPGGHLLGASCLWNLVEVRLNFFCLKLYALYIIFRLLFFYFILFYFFSFYSFYFILLLSLFHFILFQIIHLSSSFFLINCGIFTNRKWTYPLVSLLPFLFSVVHGTLLG